MTTSVENNSVFKIFFEKQKLARPNFIDWYTQLRLQVPHVAAAVKGLKEVSVLMLLTMDLDIQRNLAHLGAYDMLEELKAIFSKQVEQELLQTVRQFHACNQPVGQNLAVSLILVSLNKDYDSFVQNYNMHGMGKTVDELHAMLKLHEDTLPKKDATHALHAIRAGRVQKTKKINRTKLLRAVMGLQGSKKLKPGALSLYMGDGHRAAVEAIGTYHLELPSGVVIVLNNCHYAPSITRGNCVSCMSGKMERKPYSHQVERAKDLLGLIHTDVFQKEIENQLEKTIKSLHSDRGDMVRSMMSQTTLPKSFWDYALETDTCILNTVPTKKVDKTPYEILYGQAPKLSYLKFWGYEELVKYDTLTKPEKLHPRSFRCIVIGYPKETMGYSFYNPSENNVFIAQNAEYFENDLIDRKASGSVEDLELIQEEDTNPSLNTSLDHEEDDQEINEPQSDINPNRKSSRTRRASDRMCLYIDAKEHELGDLGDPASYKAALLDLESKKWLDAMNVEMQSMKYIDTDMDGAVSIFKARLVAKGFTQTYKVDYEETFSPVADIRAIRILIAIAAYYDYEIWQMDVKTAFLNGHHSEEVYKEQHENAEYIAAFDALKKAVWIRKFIFELGIVPIIEEPISMYCDDTGAIAIAKDDGVTKGARHFYAKVPYLRETSKLGDVKIEKVDTDDNLADLFIKP
nr:hypothetical protein [Tanacetum cinerariifolium]